MTVYLACLRRRKKQRREKSVMAVLTEKRNPGICHFSPDRNPGLILEEGEKGRSPAARILIGGDFCPLRRYEEKLLRKEAIFSEELSDCFSRHDFTLVNLEAPLCDNTLSTASRMGFGLRCSPSLAPSLKNLGIDAVTLANNHILDFRAEGLFQTLKNLDRASIPHAGAGKDLEEAEQPLEVLCGANLRLGIWALAEKELNCAGEHSPGSAFFSPERNLPVISGLRSRCDFLLVSIHAGHEFTSIPSPRIRSAYRAFIDAGADLVVGHHPHVMQGVERHGRGWIAYSLGNLVFDSDYVSAYAGTDLGFLLSAGISHHHVDTLSLIPYRMSPSQTVELLKPEEVHSFQQNLGDISALLAEENAYRSAWEDSVRFRWETAYREILRDFSTHFFDPENADYALRAGNLFSCPTHLEMLQEICRMLEEGKLSRLCRQ